MLEFGKVCLSDKQRVDALLALSDYNGCSYCFGSLYCWGGHYNTEIAVVGDCLYIVSGKEDKRSYTFPAGKFDLKEAIETVMEDARQRKTEFSINAVTAEQRLLLEQSFPDMFEYTADRDFFDYIYAKSDLTDLAGKKYHGKRNHISKFLRKYEKWRYEEVTPEKLADCKKVAARWCSENNCNQDDALTVERCALGRALDGYEALGLSGGLLYVEDEPVAFCLGERLNGNTFITHYEKALRSVEGAYTMINREFAKNTVGDYQFINREEDTGDEGLRKAKLSYHPAILLEKYYVTLKG